MVPMSATTTTTDLFDPADVTTDTRPSAIWEGFTCGRCGGTGRMPFAVANGVCFGCHGTGWRLTKRGAEARRYFMALRETTVDGLTVGDRVLDQGIPGIQGARWVTVTAIRPTAETRSSGSIHDPRSEYVAEAIERGDVVEPYYPDAETGEARVVVYSGLDVQAEDKRGERRGWSGVGPRQRFTVSDKATEVARMKAAAEYQRALTKAGKPRKGTRYAA